MTSVMKVDAKTWLCPLRERTRRRVTALVQA